MSPTPHLFPALFSSGFCGEQGVFLPQRAQSFAQGAQRGYGAEWCSSSSAVQYPQCPRGAMSAGDADAEVRVFSLRSKQACRLDFWLLFGQAKRREEIYIYGDNGIVALYLSTFIKDGTDPNDTVGGGEIPYKGVSNDSIYYIHTDHLGSYCAITNAKKQVKQRNYFDPWGNFKWIYKSGRDTWGTSEPNIPSDSLEVGTAASLNFTLTRRGFTGHEHYPQFKIINMNGRLYDPVIGRFFSPDKYVANSSFTQDFNRYTYCRNNLLMYTDPSGEFLWFSKWQNAKFSTIIEYRQNNNDIKNQTACQR